MEIIGAVIVVELIVIVFLLGRILRELEDRSKQPHTTAFTGQSFDATARLGSGPAYPTGRVPEGRLGVEHVRMTASEISRDLEEKSVRRSREEQKRREAQNA